MDAATSTVIVAVAATIGSVLVALITGRNTLKATQKTAEMSLESAKLSSQATIESVVQQVNEQAQNQIRHHNQVRRAEEREYLLSVIGILREQRSKLQYLSNKGKDIEELVPQPPVAGAQLLSWEREREEAYGLAYSVMLSVPDNQVRAAAPAIMTAQSVQEKQEAIDNALIRVGEMIKEIHNRDS